MDTGLKNVVHHFGFARAHISVIKLTLKSIVVAVVASRLGNVLKLYICWIGEANFAAGSTHLWLEKIGTNYRHVIGMEGQITLLTQCL